MRKLCRAGPTLANYLWRGRLWRFQTPLPSIQLKTIAARGDKNQAPTGFLGFPACRDMSSFVTLGRSHFEGIGAQASPSCCIMLI